jgi:hypothetical protein
MGILLEGGYKDAVRSGDSSGLADAFLRAWGIGSDANPLAKGSSQTTGEYERMNRDSGRIKFFSRVNLPFHVN